MIHCTCVRCFPGMYRNAYSFTGAHCMHGVYVKEALGMPYCLKAVKILNENIGSMVLNY